MPPPTPSSDTAPSHLQWQEICPVSPGPVPRFPLANSLDPRDTSRDTRAELWNPPKTTRDTDDRSRDPPDAVPTRMFFAKPRLQWALDFDWILS